MIKFLYFKRFLTLQLIDTSSLASMEIYEFLCDSVLKQDMKMLLGQPSLAAHFSIV